MGNMIGDLDLGLGIGICIGDWVWGFGFRITGWDLGFGLRLGIGDCEWYWGLRLVIWIGDWDWIRLLTICFDAKAEIHSIYEKLGNSFLRFFNGCVVAGFMKN